jgi:peptidoglycan/LPS O-acetylase OafA/YrhL
MAETAAKREVFQSLTGLRFVLAVWITLYHLAVMNGPPGLSASPLLAVGNARVDGFFLLSGFVLAHIYAVRTGGRFAFGPFLQARIARLYPLHLLGLAMLGIAVLAALATGRAEQAAAYTPLGFIANLFMLQGWSIPGAGAWNFPAWTLSAEFFAYLCFPAFVIVAAKLAARPLLLLALAIAAVALAEIAWGLLAEDRLGNLTQNWGILRGACGVLVGIAVRYAFEKVKWTPLQAAAAAISGAFLAGATAMQEGPLVALHAAGALLILGFAALDRDGRKTPLGSPVMQHLGEISYALFILHVPLFVIAKRTLSLFGWDGVLTVPVALGFLGLALITAFLANRLVEAPAREAIRSWRRPSLAPAKPSPRTP